jgi:YegS/Rv2252/BmrU family lipid kinase
MASTLVIYNPVAGRGRVQAMWPEIEAALHNAGVTFDAMATTAPGKATELARSASGKYSTVVGIGGDGTMSEIANGLIQGSKDSETISFAIVPLGNGDDFVKVLPPEAAVGSSGYHWRTAIHKIAAGDSRLYDVGRMSTDRNEACRYFLNIVDVGFGAHTVANFSSVPKFLSGNPAYLAAVLKTMIRYPVLRMRIALDGVPAFEQLTTMTAIGNGRCFGGGFWVCPKALPDDGMLDVMVADRISRPDILRLLPKMKRGTHVDDALIRMSRVRRIVLESDDPFFIEADGEMPFAPARRLAVDILPGKLRLIV